jgi:Tol biopolymer transport system component
MAVSGSSPHLVVLRQALPAHEAFAAADSLALSADGRFVAFVSRARLSATDTHGVPNVYVFDRVAGTIDLETPAVDGSAADGESRRPMLSADGRYLVFASSATNLLGLSDTNADSDIFLRDRSSGTIRRMSLGARGEEISGPSEAPAISNDGSTIVFASRASNFTTREGERSRIKEIHVVRPVSGMPKAVPVSVDALGRDRASDSFAPALSGNGNVVAFVSTSAARRRRVVFVRDLGWERAASIPCGGEEVTDADCYDPRLSADGRVVVFTVSRDRGSGSTPVRTDIVVHDRIAARTVVITRTGNANSARARVSGNGRFVAFESLASNLPCNRGCRGESTDENLVADIYLFDRLTDTFTRVSRGGEEWWAPSVGAWLDGEGTSIAFSSRQPVDGNDPASDFDLFIRTLSPATITSSTR